MATNEQIKAISVNVEKLLLFQNNSLVSKPEWGRITFNNAERDLQNLFTLLGHLAVLPLEYLTENAAQQIGTHLGKAHPVLQQIEGFNIEQPNAPQTRDSLVQQIHTAVDQIYNVASPWIPFLAYQKGDVSKNIEKLNSSLDEAKSMIDKAKTDIEKKAKDIDEIIIKAREASAQAGAAVFTKDFDTEAKDIAKRAGNWLWASGILGVATLAVAALTWFWTQEGLSTIQLWQKVASKIVALSVLLTATFWCGRVYKALMHQSTINRHRALSLQTFQAFVAAGSDTQTKDAVLREATRCIFSAGLTGYVDSGSAAAESDSKIIEVCKSIVIPK